MISMRRSRLKMVDEFREVGRRIRGLEHFRDGLKDLELLQTTLVVDLSRMNSEYFQSEEMPSTTISGHIRLVSRSEEC